MIEIRPSGEEPETTHVLSVAPEEAPQQRFPLLYAALWWVLPATALIAGGWTAAMVLAAAGAPFDLSTALTCGAAAAVALFGGMCLFERLVGLPGAALGAGVTLQLIHSPFVESGIIPGWSTSMGWIVTALATGALTWWVHARRPPVIRTAEPVVASRGALAELTGSGPPDPAERVPVSGRFRVSGWPRTALQAVELPGNPPAEIDAVVSIETASSRGTAFMIRNDGRHADLVTNEHLFTGARSARVSIAGTIRGASVLPRPDPERFARRLGELVPRLDRAQRLRLAQDTDLRLVRIDSSGLPVAPLQISTAAVAGELALSVGYPHGGIPRFVWPVHPVPLPVIGVGRLVRNGEAAELWTSWRVQSGNSGGPVLVREHGRLRVAAVTHVQHDARRSRGNVAHIPAVVLRAYIGALDAAAEAAGPLSDGRDTTT